MNKQIIRSIVEACAKQCDDLAELNRELPTDSMWQWGECAAAIRNTLPSLIEKYGRNDKDAERYRWLAANGKGNSKLGSTAKGSISNLKASFSFAYWVDDIDAAIDTAIANEKGK